ATRSAPPAPRGRRPRSHGPAGALLPAGWATEEAQVSSPVPLAASGGTGLQTCAGSATFEQGNGTFRRVTFPAGFTPVTQLEHARLGIITPQMRRVGRRGPQLSAGPLPDPEGRARLALPPHQSPLPS